MVITRRAIRNMKANRGAPEWEEFYRWCEEGLRAFLWPRRAMQYFDEVIGELPTRLVKKFDPSYSSAPGRVITPLDDDEDITSLVAKRRRNTARLLLLEAKRRETRQRGDRPPPRKPPQRPTDPSLIGIPPGLHPMYRKWMLYGIDPIRARRAILAIARSVRGPAELAAWSRVGPSYLDPEAMGRVRMLILPRACDWLKREVDKEAVSRDVPRLTRDLKTMEMAVRYALLAQSTADVCREVNAARPNSSPIQKEAVWSAMFRSKRLLEGCPIDEIVDVALAS